jgi:hypothetical protein
MSIFNNIQCPPKVKTGDEVAAKDLNQVIDTIGLLIKRARATTVTASVDIGCKANGDLGMLLFLKKTKSRSSAAAENRPCPFGEIIDWTEGSDSTAETKTGVRGGIIEAGQDQWWEPNHEISTLGDREKLLWIEMEIIANTLDDGSVTLSGIKSGNRAGMTWHEGDTSDGYPDKIIPPVFPPEGITPGAGKIILPIGKITVSAGAITLEAAGCGHFVVTHCPGVLSHSRRGIASGDLSESP